MSVVERHHSIRLNFNRRSKNVLAVAFDDNQLVTFVGDSAPGMPVTYQTADPRVRDTQIKHEDGTYTFTPARGQRCQFDERGVLLRETDSGE